MKQQNRKIIIRKEKEYTIGFLLDFITVGEQVKVVAEIPGGKMITANIEDVTFQQISIKKAANQKMQYETQNRISSTQIIEIVSNVTGISIEKIKSDSKKRECVYARYIIVALTKKIRPGDSSVFTGLAICRDHSGVLKARKEHEICMAYDDYAEMYNKCEAEIKAII